MRRVLTVGAGVVGLAVLAVGVFLLAAWVADGATRQTEEVVAPPIADPVLSPAASEVENGVADPGGLLETAPSGPPMAGVSGGRWILPSDLIGDVPDAAGTTPDASPPGGTTTEPTPATPVATPEAAAAAAEQLGTISLEPPPLITRFIDLCTTGAQPCPIGVAASVVPLAGDTPGAGINAKIWPGLTSADPAVRCDAGFHTGSSYPVVVTTDVPVARLDVVLTLGGVGVLHDTTLVTSPAESARYQKAVDLGGLVGIDLSSGVQHCVSLRTEGDPGNVAAHAGIAMPDPRTYTIDVFAVPTQGPGGVRTSVTFNPGPLDPRPSTVVVPLSGHVVQVVTAERAGTPSTAWVAPLSGSLDYGPTTPEGACAAMWGVTKWAEPPGAPKDIAAAALEAPGYPFDRSYTQTAVRNIVMPETSRYALCLEWTTPAGTDHEVWRIESPDGFRPSIRVFKATTLSPLPHAQRDWEVSAPGAGCGRATVLDENDSDDYLPGSAPGDVGFGCYSNGLPFPEITTLEMEIFEPATSGADGVMPPNREIEMGHQRVLTPSWCHTGPATWQEVVAASAVGWSLFVCGPTRYEVAVHWRDQNVLCGSDCPQYTRAEAKVRVEIDEWATNGRRDPMDWIIEGPPSIKSTGLTAPPAPGPTGG